jgi:hypothetical protein
MADEPENHTLHLLRQIREEINTRFDENEKRHAQTGDHLARILDAVVEMAKTVNQTAQAVTEIATVQKNQGARLNVIEGRLGIIEGRVGLADA